MMKMFIRSSKMKTVAKRKTAMMTFLNSSPVDSIIPRTLDREPLPSVNSKMDCHRSNMWLFPLEFSQGCVDGRNGSSACSLIALIIGQAVFSQDVEVPIEKYISPLWSTMLYHSIVTGNNIYDRNRPVYLPVTSLQQKPVTFWPEMVICCWKPTNLITSSPWGWASDDMYFIHLNWNF